MLTEEKIRLTQYSHGAGCGCKISPSILDRILSDTSKRKTFKNLIVGNNSRDDAAVMDIGDNIGIVSTTDFFMPIVDDPFDFGRIASVNAISDIYAMGATPIMAVAILGWPINILSPEIAKEVVSGARTICEELDIPLAGGHSIDSPEPIFGLAVTGKIYLPNLKKNDGARAGASLYLTKGIGVGILSTAEKQQKLLANHAQLAKSSMLKMNDIGAEYAKLEYVQAMTDVTGFGLGGHLVELCEASNVSAQLDFHSIPLLDKAAIQIYIDQGCIPGGTIRNHDSYGQSISMMSDYQKAIICDPQTSGGLLVAIDSKNEAQFESMSRQMGYQLKPIGSLIPRQDQLITLV